MIPLLVVWGIMLFTIGDYWGDHETWCWGFFWAPLKETCFSPLVITGAITRLPACVGGSVVETLLPGGEFTTGACVVEPLTPVW